MESQEEKKEKVFLLIIGFVFFGFMIFIMIYLNTFYITDQLIDRPLNQIPTISLLKSSQKLKLSLTICDKFGYIIESFSNLSFGNFTFIPKKSKRKYWKIHLKWDRTFNDSNSYPTLEFKINDLFLQKKLNLQSIGEIQLSIINIKNERLEGYFEYHKPAGKEGGNLMIYPGRITGVRGFKFIWEEINIFGLIIALIFYLILVLK